MNAGAVPLTAITMIDRAPVLTLIAPKDGAPTGGLFFALVLLVSLFMAMPTNADEIRPALLDIKE